MHLYKLFLQYVSVYLTFFEHENSLFPFPEKKSGRYKLIREWTARNYSGRWPRLENLILKDSVLTQKY